MKIEKNRRENSTMANREYSLHLVDVLWVVRDHRPMRYDETLDQNQPLDLRSSNLQHSFNEDILEDDGISLEMIISIEVQYR